jgi:hypothetical protein
MTTTVDAELPRSTTRPKRASVSYDPERVSTAALLDTVTAAGYSAVLPVREVDAEPSTVDDRSSVAPATCWSALS